MDTLGFFKSFQINSILVKKVVDHPPYMLFERIQNIYPDRSKNFGPALEKTTKITILKEIIAIRPKESTKTYLLDLTLSRWLKAL